MCIRDRADAVRSTATELLFAECNAIAPQVALEIEPIIVNAGARFVDASIIGGPPRDGSSPRLYTSGPRASELEQLRDFGLDVRNIGPETGQASGIKMCYAALTKGTTTLHVALLAVARALGVQAELEAELAFSQDMTLQQMRQSIPSLPANAHRWIGEMEEIAATFASVGAPEGFHQGAAAIYRLLDGTAFASESPETIDSTRTLEETITATAGLLSVSCRDQGNG